MKRKNISLTSTDDSYVFVWQNFIWVKQSKPAKVKLNKFKFIKAV